MISNILLQSQKNEILILIKEAGLDPVLFVWENVISKYFTDSNISKIHYSDTDFFYSFDMHGESHYAVYSPAENSYVGTDYPGTWARQKECFTNWLQNLVKENNEPDLWKEISSEKTTRYRNKSYHAIPSNKTPDQDTMANKLDLLLEKNNSSKSKDENQPQSGFLIKRYYGKA